MTPTELHITIDGHPGAQGSKRSYGPGRMVESSKKVTPWRTDVRDAATTAATATGWTTATGPVTATITFRFACPKAHYRTGRNAHLLRDRAPAHPIGHNIGDVDKLARSTFDALTSAGVIADDALIYDVHAIKRWTDTIHPIPGASITLRKHETQETPA